MTDADLLAQAAIGLGWRPPTRTWKALRWLAENRHHPLDGQLGRLQRLLQNPDREHYRASVYGIGIPKKAGRGMVQAYYEMTVRGVPTGVHIVAWVLATGIVPRYDEHIDHVCEVEDCFNIRHLNKLTRSEHGKKAWRSRRGMAEGAQAGAEPAGGETGPGPEPVLGGDGLGGRAEPAGGEVRGSDGGAVDVDGQQRERNDGTSWGAPPCLLGS